MQQQTNFFTPTPKHLIQLHGFPNITDIIYVKPLYSVRSLVVSHPVLLMSISLFLYYILTNPLCFPTKRKQRSLS